MKPMRVQSLELVSYGSPLGHIYARRRTYVRIHMVGKKPRMDVCGCGNLVVGDLIGARSSNVWISSI